MIHIIDTHIYLWFSGALEVDKLRQPIRDLIKDERNTIFLSIASLWEMKIKQQKGIFKLSERVFEPQKQLGITILPVNLSHILSLNHLDADPAKPIHRDPFDRMMLAQAMSDGPTFVTHDRRCLAYKHTRLNVLSASQTE